jgi:chromosome segregation ATPase
MNVNHGDVAAVIAQERQAFIAQLMGVSVTQVAHMVDGAMFLSEHERQHYKREAKSLLDERINHTKERAKAEAQELAENLEDVREQMAEMRADAEALIADAADGMIEAAELRDLHDRMVAALVSLERRIQDQEGRVETVRVKEEDPVAYLLELEKKYPQIRLTLAGGRHDIGR